MNEFNRDHDPNGDGYASLFLGIALVWFLVSITLAVGGLIWWFMT